MRAYVTDTLGLSRAMKRVEGALRASAQPNKVEIVEDRKDADLVVLHVIGYPETLLAVQAAKDRGQQVALIQYCVRTTQRPHTEDWAEIWRACSVVWSYYDLYALADQDGVKLNCSKTAMYYAPLGVDPVFCQPWKPAPRQFRAMTSGYVAESEAIREVGEAARRAGGRVFHLGPQEPIEGLGDHVVRGLGISDEELRRRYLQTEFVAGLRRGEGFEFPVVEGMMCGCRPICFDRPHYRSWFQDWARFVPETTGEELISALTKELRAAPEPFTGSELEDIYRRFGWDNLTAPFWRLAGDMR